jgi:ATP-dependent Clp protease ATP-binding subunit ClpC
MRIPSANPKISIGLDLAWQIAAGEALQAQYQFIEPEHLFVGTCKVGQFTQEEDLRALGLQNGGADSLKFEAKAIAALFERFNLDCISLYREIRSRKGKGDFPQKKGASISRSSASKSVFERAADLAKELPILTSLHLLGALLEDKDGLIVTALREKGADVAAMKSAALASSQAIAASPSKAGFLESHGKDLTQLARDGKVHECIGRRNELLRMIQVLKLDRKNNPLLIGDAGVGKTAIVEGLAWRIANNKDSALAGKRIIQITVADLLAGTKYRGEFEQRIQGLLRETTQSPDVILFIDEIHTLMGAGGGGDALDAANILKPALARGELHCIGATTLDEYRKHIEKDPALERRFQPVTIGEPTTDETLEILTRGYQKRLEAQHQVVIEAAALQAAVTLSARYLPDRRLPDKAIDLLDEACARVVVPVLSMAPGMKPQGGLVTSESVAKVLSQWTGIPVAQMTRGERERLMKMAEELKRHVIGQDSACEAVAQAVQRARAGLKAEGRPIGAFLFAGPTGVGKTELAKATAGFLFGSSKAMIRLDMSEYMEKHSVAKLIGAPPGYIGHDEEGQLTGALRRTPFSVVLLDEVEKAHPDILNLFLQVLEDGRVTDSKGRTVDASNSLFIMTSNATPAPPIGFQPEKTALWASSAKDEVRKAFRPELLNRLDEVVIFHPLQPAHVGQIARIMLDDLRKRLRLQNINLEFSDAAMQWLCKEGYDQQYGARPLRRLIEQQIENHIAGKLLRDEVQPGHTLFIDLKDGALTFASVGGETL